MSLEHAIARKPTVTEHPNSGPLRSRTQASGDGYEAQVKSLAPGGEVDAARRPEAGAERTGPMSVSYPASGPVTRAQFVYELVRHRFGFFSAKTPEAVMQLAVKCGISNGDRPTEPVTRAEAITMLHRAHGWPLALPPGKVAYFIDVPPSAWYFTTAHAARFYGLVTGNANCLRPDDPLLAEHGSLMFGRAKAAGPTPIKQQCPDAEPLLEPSSAATLLAKGNLTLAEINQVRNEAARMPPEQAKHIYRKLAAAIRYRNQRDNARGADGAIADWQCNTTSMAMALNQLGVGADESETQFENQIDGKIKDAKKSRYDEVGQRAGAAAYDVTVSRVKTDFGKGDVAGAKKWYIAHVLPRLERGESASTSIVTPTVPDGHIVRIEWVEEHGLVVDDPFGKANAKGGYSLNGKKGETGEAAKGEDNVWTWEFLAAYNSSAAGRYVQFYSR